MRRRSKKMQAIYRNERAPFVAKFLEEHPDCQRCLEQPFVVQPGCHWGNRRIGRSTEVHEVLSRARGGSILDDENCRALCHECHSWITGHPRQATEDGWLKSGKRKIGV